MKVLHIIAFILLAIGGLDWGLIGIGGFVGSNWDVLGMLLGSWPQVLWTVDVLVGISAVWLLVTHKKGCKECSASM
ncbi:MAG: DUF378 domain-containing protein [Minisyncoccia bacterium]|jgi:uncharacterized membrane protein YuzA (DUF378 family)